MKTLIIIVSLACLSSGIAMAQEDATKGMVREAFNGFKEGITNENYKMLNFSSLEEVKSSQIGDEVKAYYVRLDELRAYRANQPVSELVKPMDKKIYLLTNANNRAIGFVEAGRKNEKWEMKSVSKSPIMSQYQDITGRSNRSDWRLVRVLALGRDFAASQDQSGWTFVLLGSESLGEIRAGQEVKFEDLLPSLQEEANRYNGLPW